MAPRGPRFLVVAALAALVVVTATACEPGAPASSPATPAPTTPAPVSPAPTTTVPASGALADLGYSGVGRTVAPVTSVRDAEQTVAWQSPDDDDDLDDDLVGARLFIPSQRVASNACVVILHPLGGDRGAAWITTYAHALMADGAVVVAPDWRNHGSRQGATTQQTQWKANSAPGLADLLADSVVDVRRGLDVLERQVGCRRFGIVGFSAGGWIGTLVAGADPRVDGLVVLASGGDFDVLLRQSALDIFVTMSGRPSNLADLGVSETKVKHALTHLRPVDPAAWMRDRVTAPTLVVSHSSDLIMPPAAVSAIGTPARERGGRWMSSMGVRFHTVQCDTSAGGDLRATMEHLGSALGF